MGKGPSLSSRTRTWMARPGRDLRFPAWGKSLFSLFLPFLFFLCYGGDACYLLVLLYLHEPYALGAPAYDRDVLHGNPYDLAIGGRDHELVVVAHLRYADHRAVL